MASSTTPIPPMRADWTGSGACTSGPTAHPRGATRRASGCAATTSTTRAERSRGCRGAAAGLEISRRMASERASQQAFFGVSARLFAASAALTTLWCASMSAMGELPMPGGWTMSMAWNADTRTDVAGGARNAAPLRLALALSRFSERSFDVRHRRAAGDLSETEQLFSLCLTAGDHDRVPAAGIAGQSAVLTRHVDGAPHR